MRIVSPACILLSVLYVPFALAQTRSELGREGLRKIDSTLKSSLLKEQQLEQRSIGKTKPQIDLSDFILQPPKTKSELEKLLVEDKPVATGPENERIRRLLEEYQTKGELQILNRRDIQPNGRKLYEVQQVIPGNEFGGGPLQLALLSLGMKGGGLTEASVSNIIKAKAADKTSCPSSTAKGLDEARLAVELEPARIQPENPLNREEQRLRRYLSKSKAEIVKFESDEAIQRLQKFESAWREALDKCFESPHESKGFEALKNRIGIFEGSDKVPMCTGLLIADGVVLTAKHCFAGINTSSISPYRKVKFRMADGKVDVDVDVEAAKSDASPPYAWDEDQLLVKIPKQGKDLPAIPIKNDFEPFYSDEPTTKLLLIAALPLARDLSAAKFPTGFVVSKQPNTCFIAFQRDKCLTHMCSVTPGSSGASIFSDESTPKWLGIHVGPESKDNTCSPVGSRIVSNYAVRHLKSELAFFIK